MVAGSHREPLIHGLGLHISRFIFLTPPHWNTALSKTALKDAVGDLPPLSHQKRTHLLHHQIAAQKGNTSRLCYG
jgi:hypothetical protein